MAKTYKYTITENRVGAEERSHYATCKEAMDSYLTPGEVVLRGDKIIKNAPTVECYKYDILDLQEALKTAKTMPDNFRSQVKAFVDAYRKERAVSETIILPAGLIYRLESLAKENGLTKVEVIEALVAPYFQANDNNEE